MPHERRKAIFYMVLAALAFSAMAAGVKFCRRLPLLEVVFFRSFVGTIMIAVLIFVNRVSFLGTKRRPLLVRGLAGTAAVCLYFYALTRLPLATSVLLNSTAPIFVVLLAASILHEKVTAFLGFLVVLGLVGVFLLAEADLAVDPLACSLALLSAAAAAVSFITIRYIGKSESPLTSIFYYVGISALAVLPFALKTYAEPSPGEWLELVGVGISATLGQIWLTQAFRIGPATLLSPFTFLTPVFSYGLGLLFWQETLDASALVGAALIIVTGVTLYLARHEDSAVLPH